MILRSKVSPCITNLILVPEQWVKTGKQKLEPGCKV